MEPSHESRMISTSTRIEVNCPKCNTRQSASMRECVHCGVVFKKYRQETQDFIGGDVLLSGKYELAALWDRVLVQYDNIEQHEKFINACAENGCLVYASHKYARIIEVTADHIIAKKMRKRIVALASIRAEPKNFQPIFEFKMPKLELIVLFMAGFVIVMGLMIPQARNLIGIGITTLVALLGLRIWLGRSL